MQLMEVVSVDILRVVTKYGQAYWQFFWFGLFFIGMYICSWRYCDSAFIFCRVCLVGEIKETE